MDPPAPAGAIAPDLLVTDGSVLMTWTERSETSPRSTVRFARLVDGTWSEPSTVASGDDLFANWADFPRLARAVGGTLYTHWLRKTAPDTYAYSIELARSLDRGDSWEPIGRLNDDDTPTEHGFVSYVPEGDGVRAFFLDGREMVADGPMALRTALVTDTAAASEVVDGRVCECCSTAAALTGKGAVVVYRDRDENEVRDISVVRSDSGTWSSPASVHDDGWTIEGCPVNGPEIATAGDLSAVAWFTAADGHPQVRLAFSRDGGETFDPPVTVDADAPLGRVSVAADESGAWLAWMTARDDRAAIQLARVSSDGEILETITAAETSTARSSGFPRLARDADALYLAWVSLEPTAGAPQIRLLKLPDS